MHGHINIRSRHISLRFIRVYFLLIFCLSTNLSFFAPPTAIILLSGLCVLYVLPIFSSSHSTDLASGCISKPQKFPSALYLDHSIFSCSQYWQVCPKVAKSTHNHLFLNILEPSLLRPCLWLLYARMQYSSYLALLSSLTPPVKSHFVSAVVQKSRSHEDRCSSVKSHNKILVLTTR